jgi:hypothetical protein
VLIQSTKRLFTPRLHLEKNGDQVRLVNTTGDRLDSETSVVIPKAAAAVGRDAEGRERIKVHHKDRDHWVPKESFQTSEGENGVYYLPTYQSSAGSAAVGGASKGLVALGPLAAVSGGLAGYAAHRLGKNSAAKLAIGAGLGAATLAVANTAIFGPAGLSVSLLLGAATGVSAVHAGEGSADIRDASYGGGITGFAVGALTHNPLTLVTASAAAGIGGRASHPLARAAIGGAVGAALGAGQALLTGQSIAVVAGLTAAAGAVGPLIGSPLMQATRNLSHLGGDVVAKVLKDANDSTLKVVGAVPYAVGMGFLGATAELVAPGTGLAAAAIGVAGGAAYGYHQTSRQLEKASSFQ